MEKGNGKDTRDQGCLSRVAGDRYFLKWLVGVGRGMGTGTAGVNNAKELRRFCKNLNATTGQRGHKEFPNNGYHYSTREDTRPYRTSLHNSSTPVLRE